MMSRQCWNQKINMQIKTPDTALKHIILTNMTVKLYSSTPTFYHAKLCVSMVFAVARCPSVRLSVHQSRWCIVSTWLKIMISSHFCHPSSPIILVFWPPPPIPNSKGTHSVWAQNTRGCENFAIFDRNRRLFRKRYEIGPWLIRNVNRKSYALYRMMTFSVTPVPLSMTLIDHWLGFQGRDIFQH